MRRARSIRQRWKARKCCCTVYLPQVYAPLERNEPSAWEKARLAQLVPRTDHGLEEGVLMDVREVLAALPDFLWLEHAFSRQGRAGNN